MLPSVSAPPPQLLNKFFHFASSPLPHPSQRRSRFSTWLCPLPTSCPSEFRGLEHHNLNFINKKTAAADKPYKCVEMQKVLPFPIRIRQTRAATLYRPEIQIVLVQVLRQRLHLASALQDAHPHAHTAVQVAHDLRQELAGRSCRATCAPSPAMRSLLGVTTAAAVRRSEQPQVTCRPTCRTKSTPVQVQEDLSRMSLLNKHTDLTAKGLEVEVKSVWKRSSACPSHPPALWQTCRHKFLLPSSPHITAKAAPVPVFVNNRITKTLTS